MSGQLRALRNRIRSVENTKKITRAMEMVAAAKLRRFQDMITRARPFTAGLENLLRRLAAAKIEKLHPFIEPREEKKIAVVLMTSDTGLCGSYNNDLVEKAKKFLAGQPQKPLVVGVGKYGLIALKRLGYPVQASFTDLRASRIEQVLVELRSELEKIYLGNQVDSVVVIYSHFKTVSTYQSVVEKLLPLQRPKGTSEETVEYIFEPTKDIIFEKLIPLFFEAKIRTVFLEALVSEQIARMSAMHQATQNAKEMIDSLVLLRNNARQAAITKELIEIVSGSRAQKVK